SRIGDLYRLGHGFAQDFSATMEWYIKATDQHYAESEFHLGMVYLEGDRVLFDNYIALKWINRAVEHRDGSGWSDYAKAVSTFTRRCRSGLYKGYGAVSQTCVSRSFGCSATDGAMYFNGHGILQDYPKAFK
ncbi:hypothetical protein BGZ47_002651, partial [Haplosporangium gracile]